MSDVDQSGVVTIHGTRLHYEIKGHGCPLALIHGGLVDSRMWDDQFEVFARRYRVVRYDLHGFGKSQMPEAPYSPIEDLKSLLAVLHIDTTHLVGLSLGGSIAIEFALAYPAMVNRLVLAASDIRGYPPSPPDEGTRAIINAVRQNERAETVVAMMLNHSVFASAKDKPVVHRRMRAMLMDNYNAWTSPTSASLAQWPTVPAVERLSEIQSPTLVLIGSSDGPEMLARANALEAKIKDAKKIVLPAAGHHLNMEKPEEFNRTVLGFLSDQ